jgi:hypothetical protein
VPEVFPIVPATAKPLWFLAVVLAILAIVFVLLAYTAYASRHSRIELGNGQLSLVGDFWARSIPIQSIELERAAVVDLGQETEYAPRVRTFGTGLPGYGSGWFRLRNGEKALLYLTNRQSVVYLPTTLGYSLLLSAERPQELLTRLRAQAGLTL